MCSVTHQFVWVTGLNLNYRTTNSAGMTHINASCRMRHGTHKGVMSYMKESVQRPCLCDVLVFQIVLTCHTWMSHVTQERVMSRDPKTLQDTATHCKILRHTARHCNTLQDTTRHCKTLQHTATHCNVCHADTWFKYTGMCDIRGIDMCDMTFYICVTWPVYVCGMTPSYVWQDSIICATWLITHNESLMRIISLMSHVAHMMEQEIENTRDSTICVCVYEWGMSHIYAMTHPHVKCGLWHDSFTCATWWCHSYRQWLIHTDHAHIRDMWYLTFERVMAFERVMGSRDMWYLTFERVMACICNLRRDLRHDSFIGATLTWHTTSKHLAHTDIPRAYVCQYSFICVK